MVQIQMDLLPDGSMTLHVASLLYDLWDDYVYYRKQAESVDREKEPLQYKRHVRAAVHSYFSYFEGVLNAWIAEFDPSIDLENIAFGSKLGIIRQRINNETLLPFLNIKRARDIRNMIVHVKPTHEDIYVMETLLDGQFFRDADDFTNWLDFASQALKMERHPDVHKILEDWRKGLGS